MLGSLTDFAGDPAAGTLLPPGWINMTIDYTVKIPAPVKGEAVVARGRVVARTELRVVFATLARRLPGLRLATELDELDVRTTLTGEIAELPVTW